MKISVEQGDVRSFPCDLLVMKHADDFYGADKVIAEAIRFDRAVGRGESDIVAGRHIEARRVMFIGVGPLADFRYGAIREFGRLSLDLAARADEGFRSIAMTMHGTGYGLDEQEAFLSLIGGLQDATAQHDAPVSLDRVTIVEQNGVRVRRLNELLIERRRAGSRSPAGHDRNVVETLELRDVGEASERKRKLFVAMPFADEYADIYDVAIQDACRGTHVVSERISDVAFSGDIFSEIKRRMAGSDGVLAVLDGTNANVFLELGFAMALDKPTILVIRDPNELPFDVKGQRCLIYKNIGDLRQKLTTEIGALLSKGPFDV